MGTFRFLLALGVVVDHFDGIWGHRFINGHMAVQCFYMVSGFLISLILSGKYDTTTPSGRRLFYTNRALRIFVPYWTFFLLIILVQIIVSSGAHPSLVGRWPEMSFVTRAYLLFTNIFVLGQEWTMWLAYDHGSLVPVWSSDRLEPHLAAFYAIPQAWSMSLELMFYALAPFLVRRHWIILVLYIAATYGLREILATHGLMGSGFVYRFFPIELGLFLAGVLCHRVFAFLDSRKMLCFPVSLAVMTGLIFMMFYMRYWNLWESHRFYVLVVLALPALFDVARRVALDRWLGELSYPIYLVHLAVLSMGGVVAANFVGLAQDRGIFSLALIAVTIAIAIAYVYWIDGPFESWRQQRASRGNTVPVELGPALAQRTA